MSEHERIRRMAQISVARGTGFATLAVGLTVLGLSYDPALALGTGAGLTLLVAAVLFARSLGARHRDARRTETWLLLDKPVRLEAGEAQQVIGETLQTTYRRFAGYVFAAAVAQWLLSLAFRL